MSQRRLNAAAPHAAALQHASAQPFIGRRVIVEAPASSANLGPGFDCVALALNMRNTFDVQISPCATGGVGSCAVELAPGDSAWLSPSDIAPGGENLFCQAFMALCARRGVTPPRMRVRITAQIPASRGLGSSATAVVGGLLAANALLGQPCASAELLELAVACEPGGHADNVAAALFGGLVVTGAREDGAGVVALPLPISATLRAVIFIPDQPMSTVAGRALLPTHYTRGDVTFNLSRLALLLGAFQTGRFDTLALAMDDRMHQPYRQALFPQLRPLMAAAQVAGAHGSCLSGGGSSVLALVSDAHQAERVRAALILAAQTLRTSGRCVIAEIALQGATAVLSDASAAQPERGARA
ncbi:MAG TPA: homoserine kinase [Ktedonobacterales bacterium]|jgi:homoserine kinase|nr:homoserine kinase [Ktedonobacterales bacterium]